MAYKDSITGLTGFTVDDFLDMDVNTYRKIKASILRHLRHRQEVLSNSEEDIMKSFLGKS